MTNDKADFTQGSILKKLVFFMMPVLAAGLFSTDSAVISNGYDYLKGFALEILVTAVLFSMVGFFVYLERRKCRVDRKEEN